MRIEFFKENAIRIIFIIFTSMVPIDIIRSTFPQFENSLIEKIHNIGILSKITDNDYLINEGQYIKSFPLVINGSIKVSRLDNDGEELLLYYLNKGEVCTMTLTCCVTNIKSNIKAITVSDSEIISIPIKYIDEWMYEFPTWKKFIMDSFRFRFNELLNTIDSIAFMNMDERLIEYFKKRYNTTNTTIFTGSHQDIANDLHSSREVISRLLKQMEKKDMISLSRNKIDFSGLL